jgi:ATP-dependent helicase/nuclease subunit B
MDGCLSVLKEENLMPGGILYFHVDDPVVGTEIDKSRENFTEQLQKSLNREFRLNGLISDNQDVIKAMDEAGKDSEFLPVKEVLDRQDFDDLILYVRTLVKKLLVEIYSGEIGARPIKSKKGTACTYCAFQGVCQFDPEISKEAYRNLNQTMNKKTFFEAIREEKQSGEDLDA